ncbi:hypothetical protein [Micromonospora sp. WMMD987]|jgi:hypothetical protein|uniref:hypothetical protein n=1 Tax=Micromonospora sp. WMMD987 TaxID=3016089 RepID=UPI00249CC2B4|nr:hypothetical protein [Micromonospora sp. WMMD987]WFE97882.1 hypothetical protein O7612_13790 [Micromonospora sp. WMMD987]
MGTDEQPEHYAAHDFAPDELDQIPSHATFETKMLYLVATALQIGWMFVVSWGLNRIADPARGAGDKILTVLIEIVAISICLSAWSEAYSSAARDKASARLWEKTVERNDGTGTKKPESL